MTTAHDDLPITRQEAIGLGPFRRVLLTKAGASQHDPEGRCLAGQVPQVTQVVAFGGCRKVSFRSLSFINSLAAFMPAP